MQGKTRRCALWYWDPYNVISCQLSCFLFQVLQIHLRLSRSPPPDSHLNNPRPRPRTPQRRIEKAKQVWRQSRFIAWGICAGVLLVFCHTWLHNVYSQRCSIFLRSTNSMKKPKPTKTICFPAWSLELTDIYQHLKKGNYYFFFHWALLSLVIVTQRGVISVFLLRTFFQ